MYRFVYRCISRRNEHSRFKGRDIEMSTALASTAANQILFPFKRRIRDFTVTSTGF